MNAKNKENLLNKIHLIISVLIVALVAVLYGFRSDFMFDIQLNTSR